MALCEVIWLDSHQPTVNYHHHRSRISTPRGTVRMPKCVRCWRSYLSHHSVTLSRLINGSSKPIFLNGLKIEMYLCTTSISTTPTLLLSVGVPISFPLLHHAAVDLLVPDNASKLFRKTIESLLMTHAECKLNQTGHLLPARPGQSSNTNPNRSLESVWCVNLTRRPTSA